MTLIPPPPSEAEKWIGLGIAIAKWGYRVVVLNLPTCRRETISRALASAEGALVYIRYSHVVAYRGFGAVLNQAPFSEERVAEEARSNIKYALCWRRCLELPRSRGEVVDLGEVPEALRGLRRWLADWASRGHFVNGP
ncbi:MAG: hypothetical protein TU35_003080 [Thermoproteus sp. AZ2]|uniref:Uncharacterized protein n=1 Tax=Thermoproteus sp. AZ2 TaxID=1609232 RepID=A0ACC6V0R5_9CREN